MAQEHILKHFSKLPTQELYQLLRLRNEVFIVEQKCPYSDIDNKDQESYHLLYYVDDQLAGYARILPAGLSYAEIAIGRVVTSPLHRALG